MMGGTVIQDRDQDGIPDDEDNCPDLPNGPGTFLDQGDYDGDGIVDYRSSDITDIEGRYRLTDLPVGDHTIHVEKGSFTSSLTVYFPGGVYELPEAFCQLDPPSIAVVSGDYDHIEGILHGVELDYTLYNGRAGASQYLSLLQDPTEMAKYDILFFNCGVSESWLSNPNIAENIRQFVFNGGSIYASDWAHLFVEVPFPDHIDFFGTDHHHTEARSGYQGYLNANVKNNAMIEILDSTTAQINYDLGGWVVAENTASGVEVLLTGQVPAYDQQTNSNVTVPNAPLAVRFTYGEGRVVFTTFHNEHQATTFDMYALLEEMVFSL